MAVGVFPTSSAYSQTKLRLNPCLPDSECCKEPFVLCREGHWYGKVEVIEVDHLGNAVERASEPPTEVRSAEQKLLRLLLGHFLVVGQLNGAHEWCTQELVKLLGINSVRTERDIVVCSFL